MADLSTLQQSLINARKVMNKVDTGDFSKGSSTNPLSMGSVTDSSGLLSENLPPVQPLPNIPQVSATDRQDLSPKKGMTEERINNSKLPDVIKQAMIKNPIPEIPFNGGVGLTEDFLSGVKEQMEKQDIPVSTHNSKSQQIQPNTKSKSNKLTSKNLKSLIKESVRELITEVVDERVQEAIDMKTSSDENFQFKVGDRLFYGKITSSKSLK
jgi:hypothetical protein